MSPIAVEYRVTPLGATLKALGQVDEATSVLRPIVLGKAQYDDRAAATKMYQELTGGH